MDFQTHLYTLDEIKELLKQAGFTILNIYNSFDKKRATDDDNEMLLVECTIV